MPQPKSKKSAGLGNALMNDRFGKGKGADRKRTSAVTRTNHTTGEEVRGFTRPQSLSHAGS